MSEIRTDLALEACDTSLPHHGRIHRQEKQVGSVKVTRIQVLDDVAARQLQKPCGTYITVEWDKHAEDTDTHTAIKEALGALLPQRGTVLVAGLGNIQITPDALGPKTAARVLATRHISAELAEKIGLRGLRSVSVLAPGVLGQTGIESMEIIAATVEKTHPDAVIAVDALAARSLGRLCRTIQISDTGISPGSGVGNSRAELSRATLGVPVISLGVPTVVDAATLVADLAGRQIEDESGMIVTPREIDMEIDRASTLIGHALNCALQPDIDEAVLRSCV